MKHLLTLAIAALLISCGGNSDNKASTGTPPKTDWEKQLLLGPVKSLREVTDQMSIENGQITDRVTAGSMEHQFNPQGYLTQTTTYGPEGEVAGKIIYTLNEVNQRVSAVTEGFAAEGMEDLPTTPITFEYDANGFLVAQYQRDETGIVVSKVTYANNAEGQPVETKNYNEDMTVPFTITRSTYDSLGRMTLNRMEDGAGNTLASYELTYEGDNQNASGLSIVNNYGDQQQHIQVDQSYRYDTRGNVIESTARIAHVGAQNIVTRTIEYYPE